jgi:tRNA A37 N6-isopentenylltransferase MiaA
MQYQVDIQKCLDAADRLLKGESIVGVTSDELETAMFDRAAERAEPGESAPAAFARLVKARDPEITRLYAAADVARLQRTHGDLVSVGGYSISKSQAQAFQQVAKVQAEIDSLVAERKRVDETADQASSRLQRDDPMMVRMVSLLRQMQDLVQGG